MLLHNGLVLMSYIALRQKIYRAWLTVLGHQTNTPPTAAAPKSEPIIDQSFTCLNANTRHTHTVTHSCMETISLRGCQCQWPGGELTGVTALAPGGERRRRRRSLITLMGQYLSPKPSGKCPAAGGIGGKMELTGLKEERHVFRSLNLPPLFPRLQFYPWCTRRWSHFLVQ